MPSVMMSPAEARWQYYSCISAVAASSSSARLRVIGAITMRLRNAMVPSATGSNSVISLLLQPPRIMGGPLRLLGLALRGRDELRFSWQHLLQPR